MLNFQFLEFLSEYNFNLPVWGIIFLFAYSLVLILSLEKATRKGVSSNDIFNLVSIVAISSVIGARMVYLAILQTDLDWGNVFSWGEIFYEGKLSIVGGYLGALVSGWFYLQGFDAIKRSGMSWLRFFDTFLPIALVGMIFGYIGTFFVTVNKGLVSTVPYPWLVILGDDYVHPWALYVALGYLILFSIISILYNKYYSFRRSGYITAYLLLGISLIHFITDFWKTQDLQYSLSKINEFTLTQVVALLIILITSLGLILIKTKYKSTK
jgi:phosphatidylglycerol:prolipoprotein diacylglycerol transferase